LNVCTTTDVCFTTFYPAAPCTLSRIQHRFIINISTIASAPHHCHIVPEQSCHHPCSLSPPPTMEVVEFAHVYAIPDPSKRLSTVVKNSPIDYSLSQHQHQHYPCLPLSFHPPPILRCLVFLLSIAIVSSLLFVTLHRHFVPSTVPVLKARRLGYERIPFQVFVVLLSGIRTTTTPALHLLQPHNKSGFPHCHCCQCLPTSVNAAQQPVSKGEQQVDLVGDDHIGSRRPDK